MGELEFRGGRRLLSWIVLWTEALRVEELRRAQPEYKVLVIRQGGGAGVTCGRSLGGLEGQAKWFLPLEC